MSKNARREMRNNELQPKQLAEVKKKTTKGIKAAQVRVLCKNGDMHRAMFGYGKDCPNAYKDATNKAVAWCVTKGGMQKITRVKCPLV